MRIHLSDFVKLAQVRTGQRDPCISIALDELQRLLDNSVAITAQREEQVHRLQQQQQIQTQTQAQHRSL